MSVWLWQRCKRPAIKGGTVCHLMERPDLMESRPCRDERERKYRPAQGKSTTCSSGHEFTPENTGIDRGWRVCKECRRARARAAYWRKKAAS